MNTKAKATKTILKTRLAVIADESIQWGQTVEIVNAAGDPESYTKVPQDDPNCDYGEIRAGIDSDGKPCEYTKNADIWPGHAVLTGGQGGSAQDAANAAANAERSGYVRVGKHSGTIFLGNTERNARAFHIVGRDPAKTGWSYVAGLDGIGRDLVTGAPFFRFKMHNPRGWVGELRSVVTGRLTGKSKKSKIFLAALPALIPDQSIADGSAIACADGHVITQKGAQNDRELAREETQRAARSGEKAAAGVVLPFVTETREDGSIAVVLNPAVPGVSAKNFRPDVFTGADAANQAETRARILNNRASAV